MKNIGIAAAAFASLAVANADARIILRSVPGHDAAVRQTAASLLGEISSEMWMNANGVRTASALKPWVRSELATSDVAAMAAMVELPFEFRPEVVRLALLSEVAQIGARTPSICEPIEVPAETRASDASWAHRSAVLGDLSFGREVATTRIAY
ncbi:MAG: hypothetical protein IBJ10_01765 [Phycisphaerales bacterium]|nr:hypothetical protein [Phycisphaerales bacterium]